MNTNQQIPPDSNTVFIDASNPIFFPPPVLTIGGCGISINLQTGEVTIPEGLPLSEASREFWKAIQQAFPVA